MAFDGTLPQPLLQSASSSSSMAYDVFLNHRGCDVKEGLAKDIYHALNLMGLRVFLDEEVIDYGALITRKIEDAMRSASLCIAIFSPRYAESTWCLDEVCFMFNRSTKIIPIFYNVKPSDLRYLGQGKGDYALAFSEHKNRQRLRNPARKLDEWRKALYNVSFYKGYELNNKRDEGRLLKSIINFVLEDLKHVPLEVARYPVGLGEIVADFENNALKSSDRGERVNVVGIVGMGGSGKTTLGKELYNKEFPNFDKRSFISDVRDVAAKSTLHKLQKKLLRDLLSERFSLRIDNITEGKGILRTRLRSLRVLIVLDDVDHVDQIDALLPEKGIFADGSLIIVTTRELNVLQSANISCVYRMKALNPFHAKQLFCSHAFMQPDPDQEFEDLVEKVMNACQGLPLSLTVLGEQLYRKSKDYWNSQLIKVSRILPEDITKRLKISFDALDREEKEMFLDTACFFLGEEKSLAIELWNGLGWCGLHGFETLLNKCLVELDQQNRISMHDHLRDMGRQIAMERPPFRLFPSADLGIWTQGQESIPIRGIMESSTDRQWYIAKPSSDYRPLFKDYIELKPSSCGIQLLVGAKNEFSEEFATLSKELRWLRLFEFQQSCLPLWLSLENLRVLQLYDAPHLEELWQDNMQHPPLQLRELIIEFGREKCSFQRFPRSIGRLRHLKKLSCTGGRYLQTMGHLKKLSCIGERYVQNLPEEFCNLQSLEHLELQYLAGLSSLPSRFGDLTNLRHLNLAWCRQLKMLPDSFKQLKQLRYLNLEGCCNLPFTEHNADILENITKLEYLSFRGCKGLQVVPHHVRKQELLRELDLLETSFSELPCSIGQLKSLEVLKIGSRKLESLPDSVGNLSRLTHLEILSPIRTLFLNSSSLPRLKSIYLKYTSMSIMSIPEDFCPSLETLDLSHDDFLEEIRTLPRTVKTITLVECERLKDIAGIGSLRNLQRLTIEQCPKLAELPSFAEFASMKEIKIRECQISGKMEGLEQLRSLETLEVHTQWEVQGITSLEHAERLRRLRLIADKIGALEPCIKTLQKWPGEVIICARALGGVESLVEVFTSSNLMVVEACADGTDGAEETERNEEADVYDEDDEDDGDDDGSTLKYMRTYWSHKWGEEEEVWRLRYPKTCLSHEATIVCSVINCPSQEAWAWMWATPNIVEKVNLREGKWIWIHVISQGTFDVESDLEIHLDERSKVEKGLLATGEEKAVKDVFYQSLDALKM